MIKKYCFLIFLLSNFFSFAQPNWVLKGTVISENGKLQKIEIINLDAEKIVLTNADGYFEMEVKVGNTLVIGNAFYTYQTLKINKEDITNPDFKVFLTKKIEELEEVVINNFKIPKIKFDQAAIDAIKIKKANEFPMNSSNYNPIPNGVNLIGLGKGFISLVKKIFNIEPKKAEKILPTADIKSYISKNFKSNYLSETLQIRPDQINMFFEFCKADPSYKPTFESENVLLIMDFLSRKNDAFKMIAK